LYDELVAQELARIEKEIGTARFQASHFDAATRMFGEMSKSSEFAEFLTLRAYEALD
jgi:malate synthase